MAFKFLFIFLVILLFKTHSILTQTQQQQQQRPKLCIRGPPGCEQNRDTVFKIGPTLELIPDLLQYLSQFQELVNVANDQRCKLEACSCINNSLVCRPQQVLSTFRLVPTPACVQHYGQQEVFQMFTSLISSASNNDSNSVSNILGEFKRQIINNGPHYTIECVKETVKTIRTAFRGAAVQVDFQPNCQFCSADERGGNNDDHRSNNRNNFYGPQFQFQMQRVVGGYGPQQG